MMLPRHAAACTALIALVSTLASTDRLYAQPTPFPDAADESAWPGAGPIRVFPWMAENRTHFWTRRDKDHGAIVFVGDSLVGNWKQPEMTAAFGDLKVANRGIGGDGTRGVLFRIKEDVLDLDPKAIVICIGTNDLSARARAEVIADNLSLILKQIRKYRPDVPVVLCSVPPRASESAPIDPAVLLDLNERIKSLVTGVEKVALLDLFAALATPEGAPDPTFFGSDLLHISTAGRQKWAEALKPIFQELGLN